MANTDEGRWLEGAAYTGHSEMSPTPDTAPKIIRWTAFRSDEEDSTYLLGLWKADAGHFVLYGDHLAAVAAARADERERAADRVEALLRFGTGGGDSVDRVLAAIRTP